MGNAASYSDVERDSLSGNKDQSFAQRNKRLLVFGGSLLFVAAIILLLVFVFLNNSPAEDNLQEFTFDSIFDSSLSPKSFGVSWGGNGKFFIYTGGTFENSTTNSTSDWNQFDLTSRTTSLYLNATQLSAAAPGYRAYQFSSDGELLLVYANRSAVWRHSFTASYQVYSIKNNTVTTLAGGNPLQNVQWNPVSHKIAYVLNNNIYIHDPESETDTQVTTDGSSTGGILNGIQSWVYEEEVFSDFNAVWWSQDGTLLSYLKFNESQVPIFDYTVYTDNAYPTQIALRYPYAGYTNPTVQLLLYNVATKASDTVREYGADQTWEYVYTVQWAPGNVLWVQELNRYQNVSQAVVVTVQEGANGVEEISIQSTDKWIEISNLVFCTAGGVQYTLFRLPNQGYFHISAYQKLANGWSGTFVTSGQFDVMSISGCTSDGRVLYAQTETGVQGATVQHIYTTNLANPADKTRIGAREKDDGVYSADLSPLGDYYLFRYLGPAVPQYYLVASDGSYNLTLENNEAYAKRIALFDLPEKVFTTVKGADGTELNAYYKKPKHASSGSPLIIDVYAGPTTQDVRQTHDVAGLDAYLCSQGYIMASIDGRGTGGRGLAFLQATYRQLGIVESADQRAGAKYLANQLSFVDNTRVGIWGWSFGGFMSLHGIANTSPFEDFKYKAAVSVAPVTSWTLYDSVYTERYMSTPQDNPQGYNATSLINKADNFPADSLLLMHGLADDNVHFQNSAQLVLNLIQKNVQFDTMYYPNNAHSINLYGGRQFLYTKMLRFLNDHM